jgi:hydroxymethylbilane synthase
LRRSAQIRRLRDDLLILPMRGNVDTRLRRLDEGAVDAIVLAMAGLKRIGLADTVGAMLRPLAVEQFIPAAGQGILALECLADDSATRALLASIDDADSHAALLAERAVVAGLGADCHSAVGIHVWRAGDQWLGTAMVTTPDGETAVFAKNADAAPEIVGRSILKQLLEQGAVDLLKRA